MKHFFKYIIFRFTPNLIFNKISYLLARSDKSFFSEIASRGNVYVFLGCDYPNLGDYAITLAQKNILKTLFPDRNVHVVTIGQTYTRLKSILSYHHTSDIVTIIGGGNIGELYYGYERKRNFIVYKMHEYKIISFPQSLIFSNTPFGKLGLKRSSYYYSHHPDLMILAREELSYNKMQFCFKSNDIKLCPDVVFTLDKRLKEVRSNLVLTLRNDNESLLSIKDMEQIQNVVSESGLRVVKLDTTLDNNMSNKNNLNELLNTYSKARCVITDRLHGMIFSYITGTPAIVLPNTNGKIEYSYKWISNCGYIKFMQKKDIGQFKNLVQKLENVQVDSIAFQERNKKFLEYFKKLL